MIRRLFAALALAALALPGVGRAQPSTVTPGEHFTIEVDGEPFYPLGWKMLGACPDSPTEVQWDVVVEDMEALRGQGMNVLFEPGTATGIILPRQTTGGWSNWTSYTYVDADGTERQRGHVRPGIYVAALRRYMDLAYFGVDGSAARPLHVMVSLDRFTVPEGRSRPYDGGDVLRCEAFAQLIEEERRQHAAAGSALTERIAPVTCDDGPDELPLWEWNVRYIVQALRDHPALLAWYLWDEPDGVQWRHLFGQLQAGARPPRYTGPESLPTPDLLRYAYDRVIAFEMEGQPASRPRHPIIVDIYGPDSFFSNRFTWSGEGRLNPRFDSGPFDRTPDGAYRTPADILGLEASGTLVLTAARGDSPPHPWYWDPNYLARKAAMLQEAVVRDSLWSALFIAAQGQLSDRPPYGLAAPLRCPNTRPRLRLLNDRDLVWQTLTPQIDGLRGHVFYARRYTPDAGPGLEQRERSDRLLRQFREARLDAIFRTPNLNERLTAGSIVVEALTNYFRADPNFVGPADAFDPGPASTSQRIELPNAAAYNARAFGRTSRAGAYGQPVLNPSEPGPHPGFQLLRSALHAFEGQYYLFVSNAYDARITASLRLMDLDSASLAEGHFDLDADGRFSWQPVPERLRLTSGSADSVTLQIALEPYEARVIRLTP